MKEKFLLRFLAKMVLFDGSEYALCLMIGGRPFVPADWMAFLGLWHNRISLDDDEWLKMFHRNTTSKEPNMKRSLLLTNCKGKISPPHPLTPCFDVSSVHKCCRRSLLGVQRDCIFNHVAAMW